MSNLNKCIFTGNLTRNVELRKVNGTSVADFSIAVNETWKDKDGEVQEDVSFFECTAWGKLAETLAAHKGKGDQLTVVCRARQERWVAKDEQGNPLKTKDGKDQMRSKTKFVADEIHFGPKRQANEAEKREAERANRRDEREDRASGDDDRREYNDADVPPEHRQPGPSPEDVEKARQQFAVSQVGEPEAASK